MKGNTHFIEESKKQGTGVSTRRVTFNWALNEKVGRKVGTGIDSRYRGNERTGTEADRRFPVIHAKTLADCSIPRGAARITSVYVWILGESSNGRLSLGVGRCERGRWNFRFYSRQTRAPKAACRYISLHCVQSQYALCIMRATPRRGERKEKKRGGEREREETIRVH